MSASMQERPCVIVGAGLAGSLLAVVLARRGLKVELYERRADSRGGEGGGGKSINLALSTRGLTALEAVGLAGAVKAQAIPMAGRLVHDTKGKVDFQPYGRAGQAILSVSRRGLNELLLDAAEAEPNVKVFFEQRCVDINWHTTVATMRHERSGEEREVAGQVILGADGAFSGVRQRLQRSNHFNFSQEFLAHGYKELTMPPTEAGEFALAHNGLHIWPRHDFMLIALPNKDKTFTCTLFMAMKGGEASFAALKTREAVRGFFAREFGDVVPLMPRLEEEFLENPTGSLVMIRCDPWHKGEGVGVLGDAAHAIVPFYGQGMNASFEDVTVLSKLLDRYGHDWGKVLPRFGEQRRPDAEAIRALALHNYVEMRSSVAKPWFVLRKKVEKALHRLMPGTFIPLYTMVTFSNIPYGEVIKRAARQDRWLNLGLLLAALLVVAAVGLLIWAVLAWNHDSCGCSGC
jgi:kynurenine 3-monooxygenase